MADQSYSYPQQPGTQAAPYANYPPAPGTPGAPAPQDNSTNGFAIASLIFGIIGGTLLAIIFGIVGLVQIKNRGQKGKGLAIAGIVLAALWIVGIVTGIILLAAHDSKQSAPDYTGDISVTRLDPGDCINGLQESNSVKDLPKVPCTGKHEGEVFAVFDLPSGSWPGTDAVAKQAEDGCSKRFDAYTDSKDEKIQLFYLHPLQESWSVDRGVTCVATKEGGLTSSLKK
ncbi:DUF4190 domain-containing protein [Actinoplanes sp. N902-109]|uniref:DUF4190 domain-containing protein n=1 Tax=Actinoplanes sp. (strain N902-109) TaxID=649831 RepID=UPI000329447F|nr:DUF4190 domain-containing protein [Actinoplanes sp. N902-109]AGL15461.1 hypothetical protein L083_1951 [Actinoplanes sp. N902-109]